MATKPSDLGRDLGKLEGGVDVLSKLSFAVIGFLIAIVGGGFFMLSQIYDLKSTVADIKRDTASAVERITKIEKTLGQVEAGQGSVTGSLARIELAMKGQPQPAPTPQLLLISINDAKTIRSALKFDPDI